MRPLTALLSSLLTATATAHAGGEAIFGDGFESASLCAWSATAGGPTECCPGPLYSSSFDQADGPWPAPWVEVGASAEVADVVGGEARLRPVASGYSLARMVAPIDTLDVEVRFTVRFEDVGTAVTSGTQGVGFYVRQNGGYLDQSHPMGQGYAVFVEDFRAPGSGIGVWREVDGVESPLGQIDFDSAHAFANEIPYRVRFRVNQVDLGHTLLQAKVWPASGSEPAGWQVSNLDGSSPVLQGVTGGIAVDSWSSITGSGITAHTRVDDIEVERLCSPLAGLGSIAPIDTGFAFTEGPLWRGDHLLFTDIDGDSIERLDPPAALSVHRAPSGRSNGLATAVDGALLAAEHQGRRVAREDPGSGVVSEVVGLWQGMRFSSPNDLAVRSDGTLYFTDPDYGLASPGDREIPFNGLFRLPPMGPVVAEWQGAIGVNQPNGVSLSPDESVLYVTDTEAGTLLAFDVEPDGSLSGMRTLVSGLTIPDGMCVDARGTVWVATWAPSLEAFTADGTPWGPVALPQSGTNCAFGGADLSTLYVTAGTGLYAVDAVYPGIPGRP